MYYLIGLEGSDGSSNDVLGYFSDYELFVQGATETNSQQLPCLEVFKHPFDHDLWACLVVPS